MSVVIVLILASLTVGLLFLCAFIWSVRSGQYEDTLTPSMRVLMDDSTVNPLNHTGGPSAGFTVSEVTPSGSTNNNNDKTCTQK